jgi:menaquinone-dependent protoporphyrinogen IX oxidase
MVFGGKLDSSQLSFAERIMVKVVHALPGDHRRWDVVDRWADHIATELIGPHPSAETKGTRPQGIGL